MWSERGAPGKRRGRDETEGAVSQRVKKVATATFLRGMCARWTSIPQGKVGPSCASGVISEAHVPGNDGFSFDSCGCGRRNSARLSSGKGSLTVCETAGAVSVLRSVRARSKPEQGGGMVGGAGAAAPPAAGGPLRPGGADGPGHGLCLRPGGLCSAGPPQGRGGGGVRRLPGPVGARRAGGTGQAPPLAGPGGAQQGPQPPAGAGR